MGKLGVVFAIAALLTMANGVLAYGYGTSSISLGSYSTSMMNGNSTSVSYKVNLASGSTWGTTLNVVDSQQLNSQGIAVTLNPSSGDPPFSGTMSIKVGAATPRGNYSIVLSATGDDPSSSNATFALSVFSASPTTIAHTTTANTTNNRTTTLQQTTTAQQPTTTVNYSPSGTTYYSPGNGTAQLASSALILIIVLATLYGLFVWKSMLTRLVIIGTALILIGTVAWLYGDYAGGIQSYIWGGFAGILIGTAVWAYGDMKGGTFEQATPRKLVWISIILILVGAMGWGYGEAYAPGTSTYWWGGTALLVVGMLLWLYGDAKAGAFLRRK